MPPSCLLQFCPNLASYLHTPSLPSGASLHAWLLQPRLLQLFPPRFLLHLLRPPTYPRHQPTFSQPVFPFPPPQAPLPSQHPSRIPFFSHCSSDHAHPLLSFRQLLLFPLQ